MRSLAAVSHELHARYATELGTGLTPRGTLDVYETGAALARAPHDPDSQLLSPVEAVELEPALSPGIAGAIFHPGELSGDPAAFVTAVAAAAVAAGVDLHSGNEVTSVRALRGRTVVLAAGAWTRGLARDAGLRVPVEAGKGYHVDYEALAGDPHIPVFVHESRIAVTRLADRLRVTGVLALHGLDLSVDRRRVASVERTAAARIAGLQGRRPLELWAGLRPCSPDGLPIIGRSAAREDVIVATGHGMLGFALAPVTGRLVRQLVTGEQPVVELGQLRPDRFRPLMGRRAPSATRSPARA
jgi:D-amino-acid dehydrogenase